MLFLMLDFAVFLAELKCNGKTLTNVWNLFSESLALRTNNENKFNRHYRMKHTHK